MKKIILFLITIITFFCFNPKNTFAETSFYEENYIPNIWMNKKNPNDGLIYYNQARFIKEKGTNKIAYCLEPFIYFNQTGTYTGTLTPTNYTNDQIRTMTLIAHFGHSYQNHTEPKWYAITQMMIWKVAHPNAQYYFTSTKNGSRISFDAEMNEIQTLIDNYKKHTSFNEKTYTIVTNNKLIKTDTNKVLNTYKATDNTIKINNNTIETPILTTGTYKITLEKESVQYNHPILFYQSPTNQDLIDTGDPEKLIDTFTINVIETSVNINKLDKDNLNSTPQGDAELAGSTFSLYTAQDIYIQDITIDEKATATIKNLNFGSYYIKEKTPGKGYKINEQKYYFTISENDPHVNIDITNEVIKGKLKIQKEYGYKDNFTPEPNISFNVYDKNNNLIQTITTNEFGITEITLPFGKYIITQLTTTEGYQKISPLEFEITNEETIIKNLKNYKIEVPNTKTKSLFKKFLEFIKEILCIKD